MKNKILISLLIISFFNYIGCYSFETVSFPEFEDEIKNDNPPKELFINTSDYSRYHCNWNLLEVQEDSIKIKGTTVFGKYEQPFEGKLAIKDIKYIEAKYLDTWTTIILVVAIVGGAALLFGLIAAAPRHGIEIGGLE